MSQDLRCRNGILHGKLVDGSIEVTCRSRRCGFAPGVVVLHSFDVETGKLLRTRSFQEPATGRSKSHDDADCAAVRSA